MMAMIQQRGKDWRSVERWRNQRFEDVGWASRKDSEHREEPGLTGRGTSAGQLLEKVRGSISKFTQMVFIFPSEV